jgi:hypothetical protein
VCSLSTMFHYYCKIFIATRAGCVPENSTRYARPNKPCEVERTTPFCCRVTCISRAAGCMKELWLCLWMAHTSPGASVVLPFRVSIGLSLVIEVGPEVIRRTVMTVPCQSLVDGIMQHFDNKDRIGSDPIESRVVAVWRMDH